MNSRLYVVVNFGGPRSLDEVESFLKTLLLDKDVVRTPFPNWLHDFLFRRIAKKRAKKVAEDYEKIGSKSPIYEDTEAISQLLRVYLNGPVLTFHRYLPSTHRKFCAQVEEHQVDEIIVVPHFPQFTYATTGSIARFFDKHLSKECVSKMRWIKSYPDHPGFISLWQQSIRQFLESKALNEEEVILLFSAHGVPYKFIEEGDLYEEESERSFKAVTAAFPKALCRLSYQSKFGPGAWIKPYTEDVCKIILNWSRGRKHVVFIPISFTSDHIETLFEIEEQYLPLIQEAGLNAYRAPCFNQSEQWAKVLAQIAMQQERVNTQMLIR